MVCTVLALAWANSPWWHGYEQLWSVPLSISVPGFALNATLHQWINDGLMAVFFFLVGLEIKREMLVGELASARLAALPVAAAAGGMVVPALFYVLLNASGPGARGWGIPMATDIAFALGVVALLGSRVSPGLKVFLAALAIVDDIGAVLVIAIFYSAGVAWDALAAGGVVLLLSVLANRLGIRHFGVYAALGALLWGCFLASGVHATVAGVLLAMTIPSRTRINQHEFVSRCRAILERFERALISDAGLGRVEQDSVHELERSCEQVQSPLHRMERGLHWSVAFVIMPLFALSNAGVRLADSLPFAPGGALVAGGIVLGLVLGKPLGITLASWLAVRAGAAALPAGATWGAVRGVSWLGGIGFTMSLFIAGLAFEPGPLLNAAKLGILGASLIAGITGWLLLRRAGRAD